MDFLHNSLQLIEHYMLAYGYWAVFFGVMLENAGRTRAGRNNSSSRRLLRVHREFHLSLVMLIAATGAVIGDNIGFAIGHIYGRTFLLRLGASYF